jgi:hypothetical protein
MKNIFYALVFFVISYISFADKCYDERVFDGIETVVKYGIDTTGNWWIITSPFTNQYRYNINGKSSEVYLAVTQVVFSPDGNKWAFFGKSNTQWFLVTNNDVVQINCTDPGFIKFTNSSQKLFYSYFENDLETIISDDFKVRINNRLSGQFFTSFNGERFAFLGLRGDKQVININGVESSQYDKIIPIGFWYNGEFLYATKSGNSWEVKLGKKILVDGYSDIMEYGINHFGNCAGLLVRSFGSNAYAILISDDYYEPLVSKNYESVYNLSLHPFLPMMAYNAVFNGSNFIVFSNTEYTGGQSTSRAMFTHDGSEMFYFGCNIDCFINIAGIKYSQNMIFALDIPYSHKPNSNSIGFTTSTSLLVRDLIKNMYYSGMMVDETTRSVYNWKTKRYEALGRISNKIYLLTCTF